MRILSPPLITNILIKERLFPFIPLAYRLNPFLGRVGLQAHIRYDFKNVTYNETFFIELR